MTADLISPVDGAARESRVGLTAAPIGRIAGGWIGRHVGRDGAGVNFARGYARLGSLGLGLAVLIVVGLVFASRAFAGSWMVAACMNPDGSSAPSAGWSNFPTGTPSFGSVANVNCSASTPMQAVLSAQQAAPVGSGENLQFTPPSGSTLAGGSVNLFMLTDGYGYNATGIATVESPNFSYDSSDVLLQCAESLQTVCSGESTWYYGTLTLPANKGGGLYIGAGCGGALGQDCVEGAASGAWALARVEWADLLLANSSSPTASGFSGTLLTPSAHGTASLDFTAADANGPGVYSVTVQIDGTNAYQGTPDGNGGQCAAVASSGGTLMFDSLQPCKQSENVDLQLSTAALSDGDHTLRVTVTDAAQNSSIVYDASISTDNRTTVSSTQTQVRPSTPATPAITPSTPPASTPSAPPPAPAAPSPTPSAAACNGACGSAPRLLGDADAKAAIAPERTYRSSGLTLSGRLVSHRGKAIVGAKLQLRERVAAVGGKSVLIATTTTAARGAWTFHVPDGPSRTLTVGYRRHVKDAKDAATLTYHQTVKATVALRAPTQASVGQPITFQGTLGGRFIPADGELVAMQIHYNGRWRTIDLVRSDTAGRFTYDYVFTGVPAGTYSFRALVPTEPAYPFAEGHSSLVAVAVK